MGIQTLVKKIKTKKGMKKAEKAGETLKEKGVDISTTPKTTTGSYVTSQGEVSVNKKGGINVVKPSTPSSGGKAQSSNQINTLQPSSQNQVSEQVQTKSTPISIKSSGAVKVGEREYTGNAYIPELQKTANQVQNETRLQVNQARPQSSLPIGQGRYSSQGEIVETRYQQSEIPATVQVNRSENALSNLSVDFLALDTSMEGNGLTFDSTGVEYDSKGRPLYSGQASGLNLKGAFPKFEKKIWNNEKLVGVGIPFTPAFISFQNIKDKEYIPQATEFILKNNPITLNIPNKNIREVFQSYSGKGGKFTGQVVNEFIPTTPKQVADLGAISTTSIYGGGAVRLAIGGGVSVLGTAGALNKNLTPQQRVASGVVAVGGGTGFTYEAIPFVKGFTNRFSADYTKIPTTLEANKEFYPVTKQPQGFNAVEYPEYPIGLILEKSPLKAGVTSNIDLPKTSPLVRGGFSSPLSEKNIYLGQNQKVATSQIGLFKEGVNIPLDREFFVTPQEPTLAIPETRLSRLGLTDLWKPSKPQNVQIGFGAKGSSQIGIEEGASITRTGAGNSYRIGTTTELEAIKGAGSVISDIKKIGVTSIRGQGVDIYSFKTSPGNPTTTLKSLSSSTPLTRISGESVLSATLSKAITSKVYTQSTRTKSLTTFSKSSIASFTTSTSSLNQFNKIFSYRSKNKRSSQIPSYTTGITQIPFITQTPFITRTPTLKTPLKNIPYFPRKTIYPIPPVRRTPQNPKNPFYFKAPKQTKSSGGGFQVFYRRGGKWLFGGRSESVKGVEKLGKDIVGKTLARSFFITGSGKLPVKIAGFKSKTEKVGNIFIEPSKRALSTKSEQTEIKNAKAVFKGVFNYNRKKRRSIF